MVQDNKKDAKKIGEDINYDDEFFRLEEQMEEEIKRIMDDIVSLHKRNRTAFTNSPFVYGFSIKTASDGKPEIRHFGNTPAQQPPQNLAGQNIITPQTGNPQPIAPHPGGQQPEVSREPLVDVIAGEKEITVIAELPGADKKAVKVGATPTAVSVLAQLHNVQYQRNIALPARVDPKTAKATYKNGVLEVKLQRTDPSAPNQGRDVKVE